MGVRDPQERAVIAALYVQTGGVYYGLDNVDPWTVLNSCPDGVRVRSEVGDMWAVFERQDGEFVVVRTADASVLPVGSLVLDDPEIMTAGGDANLFFVLD